MTDKKRKIVGGGRTKFKKQVSESSKRYLMRQAKDPYVRKAAKMGYRSRAVFKLEEINDKYKIIKPGHTVVDLGAAPGSWAQLLTKMVGKKGQVIALDKIWMPPLEGVDIIKGDFNEQEVYDQLVALCPDGVDVVVSDMAPETSGHAGQDHLASMGLCELAEDFAYNMLKQGGSFACKIFQGGEEVDMRARLRERFTKADFFKPESSRKESREMFLVATGFKG